MEKERLKIFSERLSNLRKKKELTQQQLSETLQIPRVSITKYETAERTPTVDHLVQFAQFFNVPSDYLLGLSSVESYDTELQAVCNYTSLSAEAVESLADFAKLDFSEPIINATQEENEHYYKVALNIFEIRNDFIASDWFLDILEYISELDIISEQWKNAVTNQVLAELNGNNAYHFLAETMNISKECDVLRYLITEKINEYINFYDKRIDDEHKRILSNFEREEKLKEKILKEISKNGKHNPPKE